jgi:aspartate-semialdehyde dehydrogenase
MTNKKYNIAVIGATGNVGREICNILSERKFPIDNLYALASAKSLGKMVSYGLDQEISVENFQSFDLSNIDIVFSCVNNDIAAQIIEKVKNSKTIVIDKSSLYRMNKEVPLIVPEVNLEALSQYKNLNLIASPNCNAIPISMALKPLEDNFGIKRVVISTYQAVSGAGKEAMDELYEQTKAKFLFQDIEPNVFPKPIAFNIIPQIGIFNLNGYSDEEVKIMQEIQKILNKEDLAITATAVRVPVFVGHCASINVELENEYNIEDIIDIYKEYPYIKLMKNSADYYCPQDIINTDEVYVSRMRQDSSNRNAINFWLTSDNLRKGAALNAVQIAERLIEIL